MAFEVEVTTNSVSSDVDGSDRPTIDYKAIQQHVIDACGTQDKHRTLPAYISGFYALGKQPQKPFETLYVESDPKFSEMKSDVEKGIAEVYHGNIYISDNGKGQWHNDVDIFKKARKAKKAITWCVTFPQIIVDLDPFYGKESNPRPLNVIMGGETWLPRLDDSSKKERCIQDVIYAQENTGNPSKTWGFGQTTTLHKMGSALGLLNEHNLLKEDKLGAFLGKPLQFRLRIYNKPNKKGGDGWYTEELKFVSEIPEGLPVPEFNEDFIHGINFFKANDPATVEALNLRIVNTMKRAEDFEDSVIKGELSEAGKLFDSADNDSTGGEKEEEQSHQESIKTPPVASQATPEVVKETLMDFDDDL